MSRPYCDVAAAFREGTRFLPAGGTPFSIRLHSAGTLRVTSGRITCCDPLAAYGLEPFAREVDVGEFEVTLAIADLGVDQRVAAARVTLRDETPVRWEMAGHEGEDERNLQPGRIFGYGVDAGTGCFADSEAARDLEDGEIQDRLSADLERTYRSTWSWSNLRIGETGGNVVAFSSGYGDGFYTSWWGLDGHGEPVCLVTDFGLLCEPLERIAFIEKPFDRPMGPIACPELDPLGVRIERVEAPANVDRKGPTLSVDSSRSAEVQLVDGAGARVPCAVTMTGQPRTYTWQPDPGTALPKDARVRIAVLEGFTPMKSEPPE